MSDIVAIAKTLVGKSAIVTAKDGTTLSVKVVKVLGSRIDLKVPVPAGGIKSGPNSAFDIAAIVAFGDAPFVAVPA
jgi:hypothetical protein